MAIIIAYNVPLIANHTHSSHTDPHHESSMLKRTQVMILPFCEYFDTFEAFNEVIHAINKARKNALDLVTDLAVEKAQRDSSSSAPSRDWR